MSQPKKRPTDNDEAAGRRIARLSGLLVTGSVGILLRAKPLLIS